MFEMSGIQCRDSDIKCVKKAVFIDGNCFCKMVARQWGATNGKDIFLKYRSIISQQGDAGRQGNGGWYGVR